VQERERERVRRVQQKEFNGGQEYMKKGEESRRVREFESVGRWLKEKSNSRVPAKNSRDPETKVKKKTKESSRVREFERDKFTRK
jgi:hypothetical protein